MDLAADHGEMFLRNNDAQLREAAARVLEDRQKAGLEGLTGDLEFVVINTEIGLQKAAVEEFLRYTGYAFDEAFETDTKRICVLKCKDSADILVSSRLQGPNPFEVINCHPKSKHVPNARLEALVFSCSDLGRYQKIQRERGVTFLTDAPMETSRYRCLQTTPSPYTGNSTGFIEWKGERGCYRDEGMRPLDWTFEKPDKPWLASIGTLDHIATRVKAEHRDPAILEFMELTDYDFAFAIHVPNLNSITNVSRIPGGRFALVFTSGIEAYPDPDRLGPTEMFVHNYGARVHHLALITEDIEATDAALRGDGLGFLSELVGSEAEGIQQSFSEPSPNTLLVNEYIKRYNGFDGFFTRHNVTLLTLATANQ